MEFGYIFVLVVVEIKVKVNFDLKWVLEIEVEVCYDMIVFLINVNEYVGDVGWYIYLGLISFDVLDIVLVL